MNLLLITNMIPPYRNILFSEIGKNPDIKSFEVYSCKRNEPNRSWNIKNNVHYKNTKVSGFSILFGNQKNPKKVVHLYPEIIIKLIIKKPDHVILGDISISKYIILVALKILRIKSTLWYEDSREFNELDIFSKLLKKLFFKLSYNYITPSLSSKKQLESMGINPNKIIIIPNAVDNTKFKKLYQKNKFIKSKLKKKYSLDPNIFTFIFVGQLIERKRIIETIELLNKVVCEKKIKLSLLIVGSGDLNIKVKESLKEKSLEYQLFNNLNEDLLSELYTISDSLILLSKNEPWGMVINEAIIHNLSFITTNKVEASNYYFSEYKKSTVLDYASINVQSIFRHILKTKSFSNELIDPISPKKMASRFINSIKWK